MREPMKKWCPNDITVAEFTSRTVELKNRLAMCGIKDEGIIVPLSLGAENRTNSNILLANTDSLSHGDGTASGPRGTMTPPSLWKKSYSLYIYTKNLH